jgi:hypothetical protein
MSAGPASGRAAMRRFACAVNATEGDGGVFISVKLVQTYELHAEPDYFL